MHHSEGLTKHVHSFMRALQTLQPKVQESLLLTPLLQENVHEVNFLRYFFIAIISDITHTSYYRGDRWMISDKIDDIDNVFI